MKSIKFIKSSQKTFWKTIDKSQKVWYNIITVKRKTKKSMVIENWIAAGRKNREYTI